MDKKAKNPVARSEQELDRVLGQIKDNRKQEQRPTFVKGTIEPPTKK